MNYRVVVSYPGHSRDYDDQIRKAARRDSGGSGYCFADGMRDIVFYFATKHGASNAVKRVRTMKPKKRGTSVKISDDKGAVIR